MRRSWPILILGLALLASLGWGYTQSRARGQLALRSENQYHQALYRLHTSVSDMEYNLGSLLATQAPRLASRELQELRVFTNGAIENLASLPLMTVALERTQNFLNTVRDTTDEYAFQLDHDEPLSSSQRDRLRELHDQSLFLKEELSSLVQTFASQRIRWADTEQVTRVSADGNGSTPVVQGFSKLDARFQAPPGEEAATNPMSGPLRKPKGDLGAAITQEQALQKGAAFLDIPPAQPPQSGGRLDGNFPIYLVSATKANGVAVTLGVSENGGHVVWLLDGRNVPQANLGRDQLLAQAKALMVKNGLTEFEPYLYDEYGDDGNVAVVTMAPVRKGIWYLTERVKVRLARDNGELLGYDAMDHYVNVHTRHLPTPKLTAADAAVRVSPLVKVEKEPRLCVIDYFRGQEALAYEVVASLKDQPYQVFVHAVTGEEIRVLRQAGHL